ncbi:hypothetical protein [Micromonospora sp. NPDC049204]|uniref:hypothetical protein n=1 Tax=Micromonospora sp. NPDC049204 TaxID=3154351 RepID=UPI0033FF25C7
MERQFGYGIARAYAGHTDSPGSSTTTYIKAGPHDLANELSAMTGQPHPLARLADHADRWSQANCAVSPTTK